MRVAAAARRGTCARRDGELCASPGRADAPQRVGRKVPVVSLTVVMAGERLRGTGETKQGRRIVKPSSHGVERSTDTG